MNVYQRWERWEMRTEPTAPRAWTLWCRLCHSPAAYQDYNKADESVSRQAHFARLVSSMDLNNSHNQQIAQ